MELEETDILTRQVKVLKVKNGTATKVEISGNEYSLVPPDYINGNKNKFVDRNEKKGEQPSWQK